MKGMDLEFLCSEPCVATWDEDLVVTESLGELKRGRTPHVIVEVRNMGAVDKYLPKNALVGEICAISSMMPLKVFNTNPCDELVEEVNVMKMEAKSDVKLEEKWQPQARLEHLNKEEREEIERLLYEECEVFAKSDTDIGNIPDFQMDIHLTNDVPVNQAYRHLPRKLYDDG